MSYLYETHLHTAEVSRCAVSGGAEYIAGYKNQGYTGIIVTDHFFNGHCLISRRLPWDVWVNRFFCGYEKAKAEGDRLGLDVFFGWEETFDGCDDYLIYGLGKEWLLAHPEVKTWTRGEQYRAVRDAGGCVVQAHPFRQRNYIEKVILSAGCVDAVEAANGGHEDFSFDSLACRYAQKIGKPVTAGTDIHDAGMIYFGQILGVYTEKKLKSIDDYVNIILNKKNLGLKMEEGRLDFHGDENVKFPVEIRGENDEITNKHWTDFI